MEHDKQESLREGTMSETLGVEFKEFTEWMKECDIIENLYNQMQAGGFIVLNHNTKEAHFKKHKDSFPTTACSMDIIEKLREAHKDVVESPPEPFENPNSFYGFTIRGILYIKKSKESGERTIDREDIALKPNEFVPRFLDR